ncbi:MAG: hypothetical protein BGO49_28585 [Planctomycetales bacterium 71-10]|nr:MAG: hypothetical protein BGO49_28585 [Planctomycetales bacterium 71-10]
MQAVRSGSNVPSWAASSSTISVRFSGLSRRRMTAVSRHPTQSRVRAAWLFSLSGGITMKTSSGLPAITSSSLIVDCVRHASTASLPRAWT